MFGISLSVLTSNVERIGFLDAYFNQWRLRNVNETKTKVTLLTFDKILTF